MVDKSYKKIVLITGGSGYLGSKICKYLLKKKKIVINLDINKSSIKNKNYIYYNTDITKEIEIKKIYSDLKKKNFLPSVIINNAAIDSVPIKSKKPKKVLEKNKWHNEIDVSIYSSYLLIQYFTSNMISKKFGIIINIGSDLSVIAPNQSIYDGVYKNFVKSFSYSVLKHGLLGLTVFRRCMENIMSEQICYHPDLFFDRIQKLLTIWAPYQQKK